MTRCPNCGSQRFWNCQVGRRCMDCRCHFGKSRYGKYRKLPDEKISEIIRLHTANLSASVRSIAQQAGVQWKTAHQVIQQFRAGGA